MLRFVQDLHVHTAISDGDLTAPEIVRRAGLTGIKMLGIADHESVGAFLLDNGSIWRLAGQFAISLVASIEIDAEHEGHEIHILGHGLDLGSTALHGHCNGLQKLRRQRTAEELEQVNQVLGRQVLDPEKVFAPPRTTFMRPHLINPLLDEGIFPSYEVAAAWFREHIQPTTAISRLSIPAAITLIRHSGARSCLAHPGYAVREGWLDLERDLPTFAAQGLHSVETNYPYALCSPHLFTVEEEAAMITRIGDAATAAGLKTTSGSDSHRLKEFESRWSLTV